MELMQNAVDYGDAPSFIATGIARIFIVSPNIVRVTCVRNDVRDDGAQEWRVSGHVYWDAVQLHAANALIREALMRLKPPPLPARCLVTH